MGKYFIGYFIGVLVVGIIGILQYNPLIEIIIATLICGIGLRISKIYDK